MWPIAKEILRVMKSIVVVSDRECNENDVRLIDGQTAHDGKVEICQDGIWGSVCDDRWDYKDAEVVCQQLRYSGRELRLSFYKVCLFFFLSASSPLLSHSQHDQTLYHLENVHCNGTESTLTECDHSGVGIYDCTTKTAVGVICTSIAAVISPD